MNELTLSAADVRKMKLAQKAELIVTQMSPFFHPGQIAELRIINVEGRNGRTASGYFDNLPDLAKSAAPYVGKETIYYTLNDVNPSLLARSFNRVTDWAKTAATDSDIIRRRWFPIDTDPVRPSGISSTDEQHAAAIERVQQIAAWLNSLGWPEPAINDSGNGGHALYSIDLPNSIEVTELLQKCFAALDAMFTDEKVGMDKGNFNASRVWKVLGTIATKGDDIPGYPHRLAYNISKPEQSQIVTLDQLNILAQHAPAEPPTTNADGTKYTGKFDIEAWLKNNNITGKKKSYKGGSQWDLDTCPFSKEHSDGAFVILNSDGKIAAGCKHNSCSGKTWHTLRATFDGTKEERKKKWIDAQNAEREATARAFEQKQANKTTSGDAPDDTQKVKSGVSIDIGGNVIAPGTKALWRSKTADYPITIKGILERKDSVIWYSTEEYNGGTPENEIVIEEIDTQVQSLSTTTGVGDTGLSLDGVLLAIETISKDETLKPEERRAMIVKDLSVSIGKLNRTAHLEVEEALVTATFAPAKASKLIRACVGEEKNRIKEAEKLAKAQANEAKKRIKEEMLLEKAEKQKARYTNSGRPWIETNNRQLRDIVREGYDVIAAKNAEKNGTSPVAYVRGGVLVRILQDELGNYSSQEISRAGGKLILSNLADWGKVVEDEKTGQEVYYSEYPPNDVVESLLNMGEWPALPGVESIVNCPVFGKDGKLHQEPGYNPATKLFYAGSVTVGDYSATPENITNAKVLIMDTMLGEFPFVGEADKAHTVSYLLLPLVRQLIQGVTPIYNFNAPIEGSGKGMALESCAIVALGHEPPSSKLPDTDDELRKSITSFQMSGRTHYVIDNINKELDSGVLASAVTQPIWSDRTLGSNREVAIPMRAIWAITANNLAVSGEMTRRCVSIRLDPNVERPWERTFKIENLKEWTKEHRNELVTAACTLVQAWLDKGKPKFVGRQKGSFTDWVNVMGGILQAVDIPGFLENEEKMYEQTANTAGLFKGFIDKWYASYGRKAVGAHSLFKMASISDSDAENQLGGWDNLLGPELLGAGNERSRQTKLGAILTKQRDRVVSGHKITYDKVSNGQKYWRLDDPTKPQKFTVEPSDSPVERSTDLGQGSTEGSTQFSTISLVCNGDFSTKTVKPVEPVEPLSNLYNAVRKSFEKNNLSQFTDEIGENWLENFISQHNSQTPTTVEASTGSTDEVKTWTL